MELMENLASLLHVLLMVAIAYFYFAERILALQGKDSLLAKALGEDANGKLSPSYL